MKIREICEKWYYCQLPTANCQLPTADYHHPPLHFPSLFRTFTPNPHTDIFMFRKLVYLSILLSPLSFLLSITFPNNTLAQNNDIESLHVFPLQGQPSAVVMSIFEDSYGFIWLTAESGIYRYDGYEFLKYSYDPSDTSSVPSKRIMSIMEDRDGNLWLGATNALILFDRATETFKSYRVDENVPETRAHATPSIIFEDRSGVIWTGSMWGGLRRFNREEGTFTSYMQDPGNLNSLADNIIDIYEDRTGRFWVCTFSGLFNFDRKKEEFALFDPAGKPAEWTDVLVYAMYEDKRNCLWFGTNNGLFKYDPEAQTFAQFVHDPEDIHTLWGNSISGGMMENPADSVESLWVFSYILPSFYLNKFNIENKEVTRYRWTYADRKNENLDLTFYSKIIDRAGRMWLGTDNLGAVMVDLNENRVEQHFIDYETLGDKDNNPMGFYRDSKGFLWVSLLTGDLLKYDDRMNVVEHYPEVPGGYYPTISPIFVYSFYEDSRGMLWLSHWNRGLYRFDPEQRKFTSYKIKHPLAEIPNSRVAEIIEDSFGYIWAGTWLGVHFLDLNSDHTASFIFLDTDSLLSEAWVRSLCEDREKNVWITSEGQGLYCLTPENRETMKLVNYRHDPDDAASISSNLLMAVHVDKDNNLWIGSNYGLNKFIRETGSFDVYNQKNGFFADFVYSIQSDHNGILWLSTEKGLVRFDPYAREEQRFRILTVNDGLPFDHIYPYRISLCRDGYLYAAGRRHTGNGFMRFKPEDIRDNKNIPTLVLTGFNVKNEPRKFDTSLLVLHQIDLNYHENFFSFEFAALDYKNPAKNQYAYMLEGLNSDWIYAGTRRFASYTAVPPGDYVFRLKGSNNDGYWNEEGISIRVSIAPPPWRTWWAYAAYGIIFIALLYGLRRYDLKRQRLKQALQIEQVEAIKLKELDSLKSRFFANISHEFRTPLTLILGPLQKLFSKAPDEDTRQELSIMQRSARRLQNLINELLDLSRLESGKMELHPSEENIITLVRSYVQQFESLAKHKGIDLSFHAENEEIMAIVDREKVEKILFNLLGNAFKFTGAGGRIELAVSSWKLAEGAGNIANCQLSTANLPEQCIVITISDTGSGIPPEKLPRIFDRFYQAGDSYTKDGEGTGIGLALTKELVELHGGTITVESVVDRGSVFRVFLPIGKQVGSWQLAAGSATSPPLPPLLKERGRRGQGVKGGEVQPTTDNQKPATYNLQPETDQEPETRNPKPLVLIVEDNPDLRLYIRGILGPDYLMLEAGNGKRGLEKALEHIPDLVLTDVMMPEMDGFELSRRLKTDERTSHIPVIILTAKAGMESKIEGLETGADDFITKPFDPEELQVRIKNLISQRRRLRERYLTTAGASLFRAAETPAAELLSMDEQFLRRVKHIVENRLSDSAFSVDELASAVHLSRVQLHRKLKALIDLPASDYIRALRLNKAAELLEHKTANIAEIAYDVGFTNPGHFSEAFRKQFEVLPSEFSSRD